MIRATSVAGVGSAAVVRSGIRQRSAVDQRLVGQDPQHVGLGIGILCVLPGIDEPGGEELLDGPWTEARARVQIPRRQDHLGAVGRIRDPQEVVAIRRVAIAEAEVTVVEAEGVSARQLDRRDRTFTAGADAARPVARHRQAEGPIHQDRIVTPRLEELVAVTEGRIRHQVVDRPASLLDRDDPGAGLQEIVHDLPSCLVPCAAADVPLDESERRAPQSAGAHGQKSED